MRESIVRWGLIGSVLAALTACGGDDAAISGFAATGAAMINASVTARCISGPAVTTTTAGDGTFVLPLSNQSLPCMVRVSGGGVTLHSFASSSGRLNVTPLTELSVAKALGADPATEFQNFSAGTTSRLSQGLSAAKQAIKDQAQTLTGMPIAGDIFTSTFTVGQGDDLVLDELKRRLEGLGRPLAELVAMAAADKPVSSTLPRVKVFGDSLSDSGTFGLKFTVQGAVPTGAGSADIWADIVARQFQKDNLCPYFRFTGQTFAQSSGCTNYAIGGERINNAPNSSNPSDPRSIPLQLQIAAQVHKNYESTDVLLITGGGNDLADLAGAFIGSLSGKQEDLASFHALLDSVLGAGAAAQLQVAPNNLQAIQLAGWSYVETLASQFRASILEHAVSRGAGQVLVMNVPDITRTPRFRAVLDGVEQASPGRGQLVEGYIRDWLDIFNSALAQGLKPYGAVKVLDYNREFVQQVAFPGDYGFTNALDTACPMTGLENGLPAYDFRTCTATALSETQNPSNWWESYMFSDGFHPTPRAHQKAAQSALMLLLAPN